MQAKIEPAMKLAKKIDTKQLQADPSAIELDAQAAPARPPAG
jgi:hypothetical protein